MLLQHRAGQVGCHQIELVYEGGSIPRQVEHFQLHPCRGAVAFDILSSGSKGIGVDVGPVSLDLKSEYVTRIMNW